MQLSCKWDYTADGGLCKLNPVSLNTRSWYIFKHHSYLLALCKGKHRWIPPQRASNVAHGKEYSINGVVPCPYKILNLSSYVRFRLITTIIHHHQFHCRDFSYYWQWWCAPLLVCMQLPWCLDINQRKIHTLWTLELRNPVLKNIVNLHSACSNLELNAARTRVRVGTHHRQPMFRPHWRANVFLFWEY